MSCDLTPTSHRLSYTNSWLLWLSCLLFTVSQLSVRALVMGEKKVADYSSRWLYVCWFSKLCPVGCMRGRTGKVFCILFHFLVGGMVILLYNTVCCRLNFTFTISVMKPHQSLPIVISMATQVIFSVSLWLMQITSRHWRHYSRVFSLIYTCLKGFQMLGH